MNKAIGVIILFFMFMGINGFAKANDLAAQSAKRAWISNELKRFTSELKQVNARLIEDDSYINNCNDLYSQAEKKNNPDLIAKAKEVIAGAKDNKDKDLKLRAMCESNITRLKEILSDPKKLVAVVRVDNIVGKVEVKKLTEDNFTIAGGTIYLSFGEVIRTSSGARATIWFDDGSRIDLRAGSSSYTVEQPTEFLTKENIRQQYESGTLTKSFVMHYIGKRFIRFNYQTVCVAIRGTDFELTTQEDGSGDLVVSEGTVEISDIAGKQTVGVNAGKKVHFLPDGTISAPGNINIADVGKKTDLL